MKNKGWLKIVIPVVVIGLWLKGCTSFSDIPSYTIELKDAVTEQPISGALAHIRWVERPKIQIEPTWNNYKEMYVMSDVEGRVIVPALRHWHAFTDFDEVTVSCLHPLYLQTGIWLFYEKRQVDEKTIYAGELLNPTIKTLGTRKFSVMMTSLVEKYKGVTCNVINPGKFNYHEDCSIRNISLFQTISDSSKYYDFLEQHPIINLNSNLIPNSSSSVDNWRQVTGSVFFKSANKPAWIDLLEKYRKPIASTNTNR